MLTELNFELRQMRSVRKDVREIYQEVSDVNWTWECRIGNFGVMYVRQIRRDMKDLLDPKAHTLIFPMDRSMGKSTVTEL